jgi:hypothetical protein
MFPRRRSRARQVRVDLPRGRQLEVTLPKPLFNRLPAARRARQRQQAIAAMIAALGAGMAYLTSLVIRRRTATRTTGAPATPPAHGMPDRGGVTPATQAPTSDREPDEIEHLVNLNSADRADAPRR